MIFQKSVYHVQRNRREKLTPVLSEVLNLKVQYSTSGLLISAHIIDISEDDLLDFPMYFSMAELIHIVTESYNHRNTNMLAKLTQTYAKMHMHKQRKGRSHRAYSDQEGEMTTIQICFSLIAFE